jgi:hypothetical protein
VPVAIRLCLLGCGLFAVLALPACGGGDTASGRDTEERSRPSAAPGTAVRACQGQVGGFLGSMDSLRRRLAVGVAYEQYVDELEGVRSAYRRIPTKELQVACLTEVGTPAEQGFNQYIDAANDWAECIGEAGCDSAAVEPVLQRKWRVASGFLSEAHRGLRDLGAD